MEMTKISLSIPHNQQLQYGNAKNNDKSANTVLGFAPISQKNLSMEHLMFQKHEWNNKVSMMPMISKDMYDLDSKAVKNSVMTIHEFVRHISGMGCGGG